jgi:hypothetical protein
MNTTPPCPVGLYEYNCTLCDVALVCYLEYFPPERGSSDSMGAPYEDDRDESVDLINVYVDGTDVDIVAIMAAVFMDDIERMALADFKAYK